MQVISKYKKKIRILLYLIDIFSKCAWVVPFKKKGINIANGFLSIIDSLERKPNRISVDQGSEFYSKSFKKLSEDNNIKMHSKYHEEKSAVAETFIRTLKNKIYKHKTTVSKNVYFDVVIDITEKYNSIIHIIKWSLKWSPKWSQILMLNLILMLNTMLILILKILNSKQSIMLELQST